MGAVLIGIALFVVRFSAVLPWCRQHRRQALAMAVIMIVGDSCSLRSAATWRIVGSSNIRYRASDLHHPIASLVLMWMVVQSCDRRRRRVFIGAVVCNAAAVAGDNCRISSRHLIGATPGDSGAAVHRRRRSAAVMAPVMNVLLFAYGIGNRPIAGQPLPARANLVRSVAEGI